MENYLLGRYNQVKKKNGMRWNKPTSEKELKNVSGGRICRKITGVSGHEKKTAIHDGRSWMIYQVMINMFWIIW